jgi:hypothetical protein
MSFPSIVLPKYKLTLPSSKETIEYRPFLMKEEKLLLFAAEGSTDTEIIDAINEIVSACTFDRVSASKNPLFDLQYVFLQIRAKSVAEIAEFYLVCGSCETQKLATIDLTKVEVSQKEGHTKKIALSDTIGVIMRYPMVADIMLLEAAKDVSDVFDVVARCIDSVYTEDEVHPNTEETLKDAREFLDNLTADQFIKIQEFFDTMPALNHTLEFTCDKCQKHNVVVMDNIQNFFG